METEISTQPQPTIEKPDSKFRKIIIVGVALVLLEAVAGGFYLFSLFAPQKSNQEPVLAPAPRLTPAPDLSAASELVVSGCEPGEQKRSLLKRSFKLDDDTTIWKLSGIVNSVQFDKSGQSATIKLLSPTLDQFYIFTVTEKPGLVFVGSKIGVLTDIKEGMSIRVKFNCSPKTGNLLEASGISLD